MKNYRKGENTRKSILDSARIIFNERGIGITIDTLAIDMGLTKSRITNHFATKDVLFMALQKEYEETAMEVLLKQKWPEGPFSFKGLATTISIVMNIQFDFRCAISYVSMVTDSQAEIHQKINKTYQDNVVRIQKRIAQMVNDDLLNKELLLPGSFKVFLIAYTGLLTTWVTNLVLYDSAAGYKKMKHLYLAAAMHCYKPYLTRKGLQEFKQLDFKKIAKA